MNEKIFLNVFPVSSGTRWVGELDLNGTVQYRYHSSLTEDCFLRTAEEAINVGIEHARHLGVTSKLEVQVFDSYDNYSLMDVFTLS